MGDNGDMSLRISQIPAYAEYLNQNLSGRHMGRLCQYSQDVYVFSLSRGGKLIFVLTGGDPYVYVSSSFGEGQSFSTPFAMSLRKSLSNALIEKVEAVPGDRILRFRLSSVTEVFKSVEYDLVFELIPTHPNLLLLNQSGAVESAHKTTTLTDRRPIVHGVTYSYPDKKDFIEEECPFDGGGYEKTCQAKEGALEQRRKKERYAPLLRFLKARQKLLKRKIALIEQDKEEAKGHLEDGKYGDFIFMNYSSLPKNACSFSFGGKEIALDPRKNLSLNAESFYKRAKKAKATLKLAEENQAKAKKEMGEVERLLALLSTADESFLAEAEKEYGLSKIQSKGISSTPLSNSSLLPMQASVNGVSYLFGRNARQNDFLTFAYATAKNHIWIHAKDAHGAHLIIKKDSPSEQEIAMGCQIALLASKKEDGEVMYCPRKNVKRGNVPGQALVKEYRSATFRSVSEAAKEAYLQAKKVS